VTRSSCPPAESNLALTIGPTSRTRHACSPGVYAVTTTGVVRNDSATDVAYVECDLSSNDIGVSINANACDMVIPIALSAGVPGGGTWSIATTVTVGPSGGRVGVVCGNFGPALDAHIEAFAPNIVAVSLASDEHKTAP
jgi:hypothetical protein